MWQLALIVYCPFTFGKIATWLAAIFKKGAMYGSKKDRFQSSRTNYVRKIAN